MRSVLRHKLAGAVMVLVLLGGSAAAVAATRSSGSHHAYVEDVARRLGVTPAALESALQAAALDRVNAQLAAGRITPAQAKTLEQRIKEGKGRLAGRGRFGHLRSGARGVLLGAAASYLGLPVATLRSDRAAGRSLAQLAQSTPGRSVAGLREVIMAALKAHLQTARSRGRVSQTRAAQLLAHVSNRLDALLGQTAAGAHAARAWAPRRAEARD